MKEKEMVTDRKKYFAMFKIDAMLPNGVHGAEMWSISKAIV